MKLNITYNWKELEILEICDFYTNYRSSIYGQVYMSQLHNHLLLAFLDLLLLPDDVSIPGIGGCQLYTRDVVTHCNGTFPLPSLQ